MRHSYRFGNNVTMATRIKGHRVDEWIAIVIVIILIVGGASVGIWYYLSHKKKSNTYSCSNNSCVEDPSGIYHDDTCNNYMFF